MKKYSLSSSNDSGIGKSNNSNAMVDVVVPISSDHDDDTEFKMLCEVEFDETDCLPMPINQKPLSKTERVHISDNNASEIQSRTSSVPKSECDVSDEHLLSLFKEECSGDSILKVNCYILYICPQCGKSFNSSVSWKEHTDAVHNLSDQRTLNFTQHTSNTFHCSRCEVVISRCTLKTLQQHHFSHLPFKLYKCKLCVREDSSLYQMIAHIMLHKDNEELASVEMENDTKSLTTRLFKPEGSGYIAFICPVCGLCFDGEDIWQGHINFEHDFLKKTVENRFGDHFKCSDCKVEIFSQRVSDLQQHLFTHLPFKAYLKCKICNWTVSRRHFLISHMLNLHKTHLKQQVLPAVIDSNTRDFNQDEDRHNDSDTTIINEHPSTSRQVKTEHVRKYPKLSFRCSGNRPPVVDKITKREKYGCSKCNEHFYLKADLKRHNCTFQKQFQCPRCSKTYTYDQCYLKHIRCCRAP